MRLTLFAALAAGLIDPSSALAAPAQQAYLKASNTGANDRFAYAVAVSDDTVVVGGYLEDSNATGVNGIEDDNSATNSGAAYVFVRNGTNWSQQAYLKASNAEPDDNFGISTLKPPIPIRTTTSVSRWLWRATR